MTGFFQGACIAFFGAMVFLVFAIFSMFVGRILEAVFAPQENDAKRMRDTGGGASLPPSITPFHDLQSAGGSTPEALTAPWCSR